jgi:hypothetical protein
MQGEHRHSWIPRVCTIAAAVLLAACSSGGGATSGSASGSGATAIEVAGAPAANGVFDASLTEDGAGALWMSYSAVNVSPNDPLLPQVGTRLARSADQGRHWTDAGVAPNSPLDVRVPDGQGGNTWATWQYEVSRLLYDPYATDANQRWKLLWHRYLQADLGGSAQRLFQHGWIGLATAPSASGPWSGERKLFAGAAYDPVNDATLGIPEYNLAALYAGAGQLGACLAFTEPGMLATASGIYISLKCATGAATGKVILLRCGNAFAAGSCVYRGDLLADGEAQAFAPSGESYDGFSASELVAAGGANYLFVTPTQSPGDQYRGCLVFAVQNLEAATLVRDAGNRPLAVKRIGGASSFHGACGYAAGASASGIIYGEYRTGAPSFRLYGSGVTLP